MPISGLIRPPPHSQRSAWDITTGHHHHHIHPRMLGSLPSVGSPVMTSTSRGRIGRAQLVAAAGARGAGGRTWQLPPGIPMQRRWGGWSLPFRGLPAEGRAPPCRSAAPASPPPAGGPGGRGSDNGSPSSSSPSLPSPPSLPPRRNRNKNSNRLKLLLPWLFFPQVQVWILELRLTMRPPEV